MASPLPVSAVVPTRHRAPVLKRTLASLLDQSVLPAELIVVDASDDDASRVEVEAFAEQTAGICVVRYLRAEVSGAAAQRNQGVAVAVHPFIWFFDDDILFEAECMSRLWAAINSSGEIGGVNAMITNLQYHSPGLASRCIYRLLGGKGPNYAGRVLGPAVALLPEDRADLPEIATVEWLNTTCTIYRREALPSPPFDSIFTGYSLMEDLALSLLVARQWRLVNARTARIFHDSQPGSHKADGTVLAAMELVNRHYVMTEILQRRRFVDYARLFIWEAFQIVVCALSSRNLTVLKEKLKGKWLAIRQIRSGIRHADK